MCYFTEVNVHWRFLHPHVRSLVRTENWELRCGWVRRPRPEKSEDRNGPRSVTANAAAARAKEQRDSDFLSQLPLLVEPQPCAQTPATVTASASFCKVCSVQHLGKEGEAMPRAGWGTEGLVQFLGLCEQQRHLSPRSPGNPHSPAECPLARKRRMLFG